MKFMKDGEFYIRIETDKEIQYHCFNFDYDDAVKFCKKNNIDIKIIKKWKNYIFDN
mgnify:CR=1 FL=1|jgi:hypothetical protein